ncbi:hypothetical protein ACJX0J_012975 [Zea mays]
MYVVMLLAHHHGDISIYHKVINKHVDAIFVKRYIINIIVYISFFTFLRTRMSPYLNCGLFRTGFVIPLLRSRMSPYLNCGVRHEQIALNSSLYYLFLNNALRPNNCAKTIAQRTMRGIYKMPYFYDIKLTTTKPIQSSTSHWQFLY